MKILKLKYDLLLFLYGYFRQVDLSLDRSRWGKWEQLLDYYKNKIPPIKVLYYLQNKFSFPEQDWERLAISLDKKSFLKKIELSWLTSSKILENDIYYGCILLAKLNTILVSAFDKYEPETEKLRIEIAEYYSKLLGLMIKRKDLDRLMSIEHFEQNDQIKTISLDYFVPKDFE